MKKFIQLVLRRNAYFLLAAAWLFTIAFITTHYWSNYSSVRFLRNSIEKDIQRQEKDFHSLAQNHALVNRLVTQKYNKEELDLVMNKRFSVFLYETNTYGLISIAFWNTQAVVPSPEILQSEQTHGFIKLTSGQYVYAKEIVTTAENRQVLAVCLIPVRRAFFIENDNLQPGFANHPEAENKK